MFVKARTQTSNCLQLVWSSNSLNFWISHFGKTQGLAARNIRLPIYDFLKLWLSQGGLDGSREERRPLDGVERSICIVGLLLYGRRSKVALIGIWVIDNRWIGLHNQRELSDQVLWMDWTSTKSSGFDIRNERKNGLFTKVRFFRSPIPSLFLIPVFRLQTLGKCAKVKRWKVPSPELWLFLLLISSSGLRDQRNLKEWIVCEIPISRFPIFVFRP